MRGTPLRVLHVIDSLRVGGKERQLVELLDGLDAIPDVTSEVAVLSEAVEFDRVRNAAVGLHRLRRRGRWDVSPIFGLAAIARKFRPDIIHSWNAMCSLFALPAVWASGSKFLNGYVRAAIPNLTLADRDYLLGKLTVPFSDVVVANSHAGLRAYGVPAAKGICIHNGFSQSRLTGLSDPAEVRRELDIETPNIVGMVAGFSEYKDYTTFFALADRVTALRQDVTFVAAGQGPNAASFAARYGSNANPRIKLLGQRSDIENLVNAFTIGVLFSTLEESQSNSILEYMALGKPVLATDCEGNRELVREGETGFLVAMRDVETAVGRTLALLDAPSLREAMGASGRARVQNDFSVGRMVSDYVDLYTRLMQGRGALREHPVGG